MLTAVQRSLDEFRFVLASASPRRLKLLEELAGFKGRISVVPSQFSEDLDPKSFSSPADFAVATSAEKAIEVSNRQFASFTHKHVIISADTVVECDNQVLGKPTDPADATRILRSLSDRWHLVHTGVTLCFFDSSLLDHYSGLGCVKHFPLKQNDAKLHSITFSVTTRVNFCKLDEEVIAGYVGTGEGLDKAGSYGIQGIGSTLIQSIEGDFYNVVGLPLTRLCQELYFILRKK